MTTDGDADDAASDDSEASASDDAGGPVGEDDPAAFRRAVRDGYDGLADAYAAQRDEGSDSPDLLADVLAGLDDGARVLDAGCGAGDLVLDSLPDGVTGVGLDVSCEQVARARVYSPHVVQGDMTRLPFRPDSFDAVTAMYSLIHVPRSEHGAFYAELARVLRPDGKALVVTGEGAWTGENPDWLDSGTGMRWSWPDLDESKELLRDAGLRVVDEDDVGDSLGGSFRHLRLEHAD